MRQRWGCPCSCNHRIEVVALLLRCCCGLSSHSLALGSFSTKPALAAASKQQAKQASSNIGEDVQSLRPCICERTARQAVHSTTEYSSECLLLLGRPAHMPTMSACMSLSAMVAASAA
jgi:hypothetical protein